jgi:hypothetical protein
MYPTMRVSSQSRSALHKSIVASTRLYKSAILTVILPELHPLPVHTTSPRLRRRSLALQGSTSSIATGQRPLVPGCPQSTAYQCNGICIRGNPKRWYSGFLDNAGRRLAAVSTVSRNRYLYVILAHTSREPKI